MDEQYFEIGGRSGDRFDDFSASLFVEVTGISQPRPGFITVDGGFKSFAADAGAPAFTNLPEARFHFGGDEHGIVDVRGVNNPPVLGSRHRLTVPHCDPTVNLYDFMVPFGADGMVRELWPVTGRGRAW